MPTFPAASPTTDKDEFDKQRQPYFNASVAAVLFNAHPFTTAADVWLEKMTGLSTTEETIDMRRGQELEPALASWYTREHGVELFKNPHVHVKGIIAATPDYFIDYQDTVSWGEPVDIKTTNTMGVEEPKEYWVMQLQAQMYCTDADRGHLIWMDGNLHLGWRTIERDDEWIDIFVHRAEEFMASIDREEMPDWVEREARHIIAQYPEPKDAVEVGEHGFDMVAEYWRHKAAMNHHEKEAEKLRDQLFNLAENHDELTTDGNTIATLRPRKLPARFDLKRFGNDHPNLVLEYMGEPTTTRVLNVPNQIKKAVEAET